MTAGVPGRRLVLAETGTDRPGAAQRTGRSAEQRRERPMVDRLIRRLTRPVRSGPVESFAQVDRPE